MMPCLLLQDFTCFLCFFLGGEDQSSGTRQSRFFAHHLGREFPIWQPEHGTNIVGTKQQEGTDAGNRERYLETLEAAETHMEGHTWNNWKNTGIADLNLETHTEAYREHWKQLEGLLGHWLIQIDLAGLAGGNEETPNSFVAGHGSPVPARSPNPALGTP